MDQLMYASLSHTHYYWYEVGMLKVPASQQQYSGNNVLKHSMFYIMYLKLYTSTLVNEYCKY